MPRRIVGWTPPDLKDRICLVTGASRGGGKGIALALAECGATIIVTARSSRATTATQGRPETIEDTADAIRERGGRGIPVRVDHTKDDEVEALFARIQREHGRLDLLVNNAWGGYERMLDMSPFWQIPVAHWDLMFNAGLRAQFVAAKLAAPMMLHARRGLIVNTSSPVGQKPHGNVPYDTVKHAVFRMTLGMGANLAPHGVTAVSVSPGWMRTERVLEAFEVSDELWTDKPDLAKTESPEMLGRAIAHLAADKDVARRSGGSFEVGILAREYGFRDVDDRQVAPFSEQFPELR